MKILVLNGPNLNMLGIREPEIYGRTTYNDLVEMIKSHCSAKGIEVECKQSNHEGALVDMIQQAYFDKVDGIVINLGMGEEAERAHAVVEGHQDDILAGPVLTSCASRCS